MRNRLTRRLCGAAAALVGLMYLVPPALGVIAELSHVVYHLRETAQERTAGLVQLTGQWRGAVETDTRHYYVHTHDGSTHHHSDAVDALLAASGHAQDQLTSALSLSPEISTHVPAVRPVALTTMPLVRLAVPGIKSFASRPAPRPVLPPPRA